MSSRPLKDLPRQTGHPVLGPCKLPLRKTLPHYQDELKAQMSLAKLAQQCHNDAIAQLREQAAGREADLKRLLVE